MIKKVLTIFLAVMLIAMIAVIASTVDKRSTLDKKSLLKPVKSKLLPERAKTELTQEMSSAALRNIQSSVQQSADTIWTDDFEGGKENWQATGTWGSRDTPGGGRYDEPKSDWGLVTDNFNSPTTSWQNTGTSLPGNDMVLSPVITLPTEVTVGGITSPLKQTTLNMAMDFDADPDHGIMLLVGLAEELWTTTTTDPGAGSSSWVLVLPEAPPYDVQNRHFLTTPDIDLSQATAPVTLSFLYKSISEPEFDYNKVDVSTDNFVTYDSVFSHAGGIGTGGVTTWTTATADLSSYVGSTIRLRFSGNGDDGTVEPGNIFALDNIDVSDAGGSLFSDDGGDTASSMEVDGFVPGAWLWYFGGFPAAPTPSWTTWDALGLTADVLAGANGAIEPGDDIRIGLRYNSFGAAAGRGLYIDDVVLTGVGKFEHDVAAQTVECPFVAQVNKPQKFTLNISNEGLNPEVNFTWRGRILDLMGTQVGQVIGQFTDTVQVGGTGSSESTTSWTPTASGVYQIQGITALATDSESENDTTVNLNTGINSVAPYTLFYVAEENLIWAESVDDEPADPTVATLELLGFRVKSNSAPGVVTWQTGGDPREGVPGAVVYFDSLARPQDEELIIPGLDFSYITSDAKLNFYGIGVYGFTYTRVTVSVSKDGGCCWHDVWEKRRGIDPQTGTNYGGPAYSIALQNPANVDITDHVAGYHNVWVRFRYEAEYDESWVVWKIALSGAGVKAADLTNIADVPNDNGKQVRLTWDASPNDGQLNGVPISHYGVWREVNGGGTTTSAPVGIIEVQNIREMIELANTTQIKTGTRVFHTQTQQAWDFVANVTAHSDPVYNYVAATLEDDVSTNFMISAHTANPKVFANSNVLAGTSVDNLPPTVPQNLAAQVKFDGQDYSVELSWDPNEELDLRNYTVYKGGQLLSHTIQNSIVDTDVQMGETVTYAVTASDHADNESGGAETTVLVTTSIEDDLASAIPKEFALDQNYPNPFNPTTTIKFALKENTDVLLEIYNVQGQLVKTLVQGNMTAGYKEVVWDATNNYGSRVASGIYIYKIEAKDFVKSMKMILLK